MADDRRICSWSHHKFLAYSLDFRISKGIAFVGLAMLEAVTDYYRILGIPRHTDREGIRRAYRRKARQHHPDLHPDDPEAPSRMTDINVAYEALSDPRRRAKYDSRRNGIPTVPTEADADPYSASAPQRRRPVRKEPGVFDVALLAVSRLWRYVAATLPI